jgi:hypothetical protein
LLDSTSGFLIRQLGNLSSKEGAGTTEATLDGAEGDDEHVSDLGDRELFPPGER